MTSFGYYDLLEMLPEPGCAVCRLLQRDMARHMDTLLYEFVLDTTIQKKFRASWGMCSQHGDQLVKTGSALGIAALYFAVFSDVFDVMDQNPVSGSRRGRLRGGGENAASGLANALEPRGVCMTCQFRDESEARYLREIADHLHDAKMQTAYRKSVGLCLPHFRSLLRVLPAETAPIAVQLQREIWERLKGELDEFMRKSDFHNADEKIGAEGDSWRRAVARMGGEGGIFGVQRKGKG